MSQYRRITVYLRPDQYLEIHRLALQRAVSDGVGSDASAILRGIIDIFIDQSKQVEVAKTPQTAGGKKRSRR